MFKCIAICVVPVIRNPDKKVIVSRRQEVEVYFNNATERVVVGEGKNIEMSIEAFKLCFKITNREE